MAEYHTKFRRSMPMLVLGVIEATLFAGMPLLATSILNIDGAGLALPTLTQALVFAGALFVVMLVFGLYDSRRRPVPGGDLLRTAWAFSLTGALLLVAGPGFAHILSVSVLILALAIGFFVQRTVRLVYFDAVQVAPERSPKAESLRTLLTPRG